jgi:NADH:ubiquinone oxidoreductase subunit D
MKKVHLAISDSLIISRLQQKEILNFNLTDRPNSPFFPLMTKTFLRPFLDNIPINLSIGLETIGEQIIKVLVSKGYFCHGLENILSHTSPAQALIAMGRLHNEAPIFYQIALLRAFEELFDLPHNETRNKHYAIALEFARISHHLQVIKNIFYCLDLSSLLTTIKNLKYLLLKPITLFTHINSVYNSLSVENIDEACTEAIQIMDEIINVVSVEEAISNALTKKAIISLPLAGSLGLTGLFLRANHNYFDLRQQKAPRQIYATAPKISLTEGGDALARLTLRLLEVEASLKWLKDIMLNGHKEFKEITPIFIEDNYLNKPVRKQFGFGEIEGPEGYIKVSIFVSPDGHLIFRIRTPAYFIAQAIPVLLTNRKLRDIAILLHSLGITAEEIDK